MKPSFLNYVKLKQVLLLLNLDLARRLRGALNDGATFARPGDLHLIAIFRDSSTR